MEYRIRQLQRWGFPALMTIICALGLGIDGVLADESDTTNVPEASAVIDTAGVDTLRVTVTNLKAGKGNPRVAVFDEAHRDEFPEGEYAFSAEVPADSEDITVLIPDVLPGKYAVAVIQDLNGNEKLDRNIFTKPTEPYGFSGAWKSGGSSFEKALFDTEEIGFAINIKVK